MSNKIFYISVILILMVGCDWRAIKDKSIEISDELLIKDKDKTKNQDIIEVNEDNSVFKNNISIDDEGIASLEHLISVDLINYSQQVSEPIISNNKTITPQARIDLMNNANVAQINPEPAQSLVNPLHNITTEVNPKPNKNLEDSSSSTTIGVGILPIKPQEELSKKTLPSKLEDLKSFLQTAHEKEAFKEAKDVQDKISNSNIGEEIVKFQKEYEYLSSLFWDVQNKLHTQKDLLRKDIDFKKQIEKYRVMSRSFSYIEKKIKDLHLKLDEIQSNFKIADSHWGNASSLLIESTEKLIQAIEKRYDNESRKQSQIGGSANLRDINWADNFAKDAKRNAEYSMNNLENTVQYFQYSCSGKKEAQRLLEEIQKKFSQMGIF
ncbi:hypothetical protein QIA01_04845 (plasmid) [Borreliella americana]